MIVTKVNYEEKVRFDIAKALKWDFGTLVAAYSNKGEFVGYGVVLRDQGETSVWDLNIGYRFYESNDFSYERLPKGAKVLLEQE